MKPSFLFAVFLVLILTVISFLSFLSEDEIKQKVKQSFEIQSIDSELVDIIKNQYYKFINYVSKKDYNELKKICTKEFFKKIKNNVSCSKIICITKYNVLSVQNNTIKIQFISRNIYSEITKNVFHFKLSPYHLLISNIQ